MKKSTKKEKELDRAYDYADAYSFSNAAANTLENSISIQSYCNSYHTELKPTR